MPEVKFHQLAPGTRFWWQGTEWIKVSPLLARQADDEATRVVPRSARVTTEAPEAAPAGQASAWVPAAAVERLELELARLIDTLPLAPPDRTQALGRVRDLFARLPRQAF